MKTYQFLCVFFCLFILQTFIFLRPVNGAEYNLTPAALVQPVQLAAVPAVDLVSTRLVSCLHQT